MNNQSPHHRLKRAFELWQWLTTPAITLKDTNERVRSRFLAQLFLLGAVGILVIFSLRFVLLPDVPNIEQRMLVTWVTSALLLVSYGAIRKGYMTIAGILLVLQTTLLILALASLSDSLSSYQSTLTFLVTISLFTSQFYSIRFTLVVAICHLLILIGLPQVLPVLSLSQMLKGPIAFYVVTTTLAVVYTHYRSRIENSRRSQLAESDLRFKMVSELIPNYAFSVIVEKNGLVRNEWVTEAFTRLTGYTLKDIDDNLTTRLFHPDDYPRYLESVKKAYQGQSSVEDFRIYTKTGELRWLRLSRNVVWDPVENRAVRYYGVAQDITAQKQIESQVRDRAVQNERARLMRDFVTAFSHDFRTALATIETSRYLADRMIQQAQTEPAIAKLTTIRRSVNHMSAQLENLSAIATLTNLQRRSCDVNQLLTEVVADYTSKAHQQDQMIMFQPNSYVPPVSADVDELRRAFRELLRNALSFMPSHGVVTIKTMPVDNMVQVVFQDTGIGISQEHLDHIFELFYRVDTARGVDSGGVGLGLSVAKMIVLAHGGTITVDSVPDEGSIFTVRLPVEFQPVA